MHVVTSHNDSTFHAGEQGVHKCLGIRERMADVGQRAIRTAMPVQHQRFYEQFLLISTGSVDATGRPCTSMLVGPPGFVQPPDAKCLNFKVRPIPGDPLAKGLTIGAQVGFFGIELHTRRRNRVNGYVVAGDSNGFRVEIDQSVGNCSQYTQARGINRVPEPNDIMPRITEPLSQIGVDARAIIERSDTLFISFDDHEFFLCGPLGFIQALNGGLRYLYVLEERIQAEAFGPSSLKRRFDSILALTPPQTQEVKQVTVSFTRTGDAAEWPPDRGTQLDQSSFFLPHEQLRLLRHPHDCGCSNLRRADLMATGNERGIALLCRARSRQQRTHRIGSLNKAWPASPPTTTPNAPKVRP